MPGGGQGFHVYATNTIPMGSAGPTTRSVFGDIVLVLFMLAQAFDGVLTYIGVSTYGLEMEGNPIVAWLMATFGCEAGLAAAKVTAAVFGFALHCHAVHKTIAALTVFYLVVAIVPWVAVLYVLN